MVMIILCILQDKGSFSRLPCAGFSRTDAKLSLFQMNRMREGGAFAVAYPHILSCSQNICLSLSWQHGNWLNQWSDSAFMVPWERRIIFVHYSSHYWCPSSLYVTNFFMGLGHRRKILLRSRECKTRSVGYCHQVEE